MKPPSQDNPDETGKGESEGVIEQAAESETTSPATPVAQKKIGYTTLEILGRAPGSPLSIDGQPTGTLPLMGPWSIPEGQRRIEIIRDGTLETYEIQAKAGEPYVLDIRNGGAVALPEVGSTPLEPASPEVGVRDPLPHRPELAWNTAGWSIAGAGAFVATLGIVYWVDAVDTAQAAGDLDRANDNQVRFDHLVDHASGAVTASTVAASLGMTLVLGGLSLALFSEEMGLERSGAVPTITGPIQGVRHCFLCGPSNP